MKNTNTIVVVGAGLFGCVIARILAENGYKIELIDSQDYIGGNCYTYVEDGIEVHKFGSHIFHTSNEEVWKFVNKFAIFNNYQHHVIAKHKGKSFFLPFNLMLLEQFFNKKFKNPEDAEQYLKSCIAEDINVCSIDPENPKNLEEQAITLIGADLYEAFVESYTEKQWNCSPKLIDASIIKRLPIRYNYNINYFNDTYQGIPICGYTTMMSKMISHDNISICLNMKYEHHNLSHDISAGKTVIYTGAVDELFNYKFGALSWRSLTFKTKKLKIHDFQGNSVVNYVDIEPKYTRIHEFKYYHPENNKALESCNTIIQYEYPDNWKIGKERYYPISNASNNNLYATYVKFIDDTYCGKLLLGGRLGMYKYFDMDDTIEAALNLSRNILKDKTNENKI